MISYKKVLAVLILILSSVLLFGVAECFQESSLDEYIERYEEYRDSVQNTLVYAKQKEKEAVKLLSENSALKQESLRLSKEISRLKSNRLPDHIIEESERLIDSLKTLKDTVEMARTVIPAQSSLIVNLKSIISNQDLQIQNYEMKSYTDSLQNMKISAAYDTLYKGFKALEERLLLLPEPPKNPNKIFGFIPLPSRKVVGVVSFVGGVAATVYFMDKLDENSK